MNSVHHMRSRLSVAAAVAVVLAVPLGSPPAIAAPQQSPGVTLAYSRSASNPGNAVLSVRGVFPMSEGAAYDLLDHLGPGGGVDFVVYADDPGENDARIGNPHGYIGRPGPPGGAILATPNGLAFYREIEVPRGDLDEDFCFSSGCSHDDVDEVYVGVRFVPGTGAGELRANTNAISGRFGD